MKDDTININIKTSTLYAIQRAMLSFEANESCYLQDVNKHKENPIRIMRDTFKFSDMTTFLSGELIDAIKKDAELTKTIKNL